MLLGWLAKGEHDRERDYQAARQQYEDTDKIIPPGAMFPGERRISDPKSYRDEWRSEQDLKAQREMADWTFYIFMTSVAGLVVTGLGVFYVARTLKTATDANAIARDIGEKQVRAYVQITGVAMWLENPGGEDPPLLPRIVVSVKNSGNSPALKFAWNAVVYYEGNAITHPDVKFAPPAFSSGRTTVAAGDMMTDDRTYASAYLREPELALLHGKDGLGVTVTIVMDYEDVFETRAPDEAHFTCRLRPGASDEPVEMDLSYISATGMAKLYAQFLEARERASIKKG